ncbi:MAG: hypothetical protein HOL08_07985 [Opitutae bacterium]|nr:hypothetical protein [Opitutae bacterium]
MKQRSRRLRQGRDKTTRGIILIASVTILIVVASIVGISFSLGKKDIDRVSGCPKAGASSITVVLVDLTDSINPVQAAALGNVLKKIRNKIPKFGKLEVYTLRDVRESVLAPAFSGCSPGSGRDVDSRLYGNPELADRLWSKVFASNVDLVIKEISRSINAQTSPILEGIQSVSVTAFNGLGVSKGGAKKLIVISDMLHSTQEMSMYRGMPSFKMFKKTQYFRSIKPDLENVDVDIFLIVRKTRTDLQRPPLYKFWVEDIAASGGFLKAWQPLQ